MRWVNGTVPSQLRLFDRCNRSEKPVDGIARMSERQQKDFERRRQAAAIIGADHEQADGALRRDRLDLPLQQGGICSSKSSKRFVPRNSAPKASEMRVPASRKRAVVGIDALEDEGIGQIARDARRLYLEPLRRKAIAP